MSAEASLLPQAIGHRGYKAAYPENSMAAFRGAMRYAASPRSTRADGAHTTRHDTIQTDDDGEHMMARIGRRPNTSLFVHVSLRPSGLKSQVLVWITPSTTYRGGSVGPPAASAAASRCTCTE